MHIPTFVFIFILFLKNILLLLLYPKHVIKLLGYNLGCYSGRHWEYNPFDWEDTVGIPAVWTTPENRCEFPFASVWSDFQRL